MYLKVWMFIGVLFIMGMVILGRIIRTYDLRVVCCDDQEPEFRIIPSKRNKYLTFPIMLLACIETMILLVFFAAESASDLLAFCGGLRIFAFEILFFGALFFWTTLLISVTVSEKQRDDNVVNFIGTPKGDKIVKNVMQDFRCPPLSDESEFEKSLPIPNRLLH